MIIIYHPINLVYLASVKTGSVSVKRYIENTLHYQYYNYHIARSNHRDNYQPNLMNFYLHSTITQVKQNVPGAENFKFFTSIRNPYKKLVSFYEYRYQEGWHLSPRENILTGVTYDWRTFETWIKSMYDKHGHCHVDKSIYYENNIPACDYYIDTDNLYADLDGLLQRYDIYKPNIERKIRNKGPEREKPIEEYYTPELKQIVEESFKWEINKFNYECKN